MTQKKKAAVAAPMRCKDTTTLQLIQQVRRLFLTGRRFTAKQINNIVGFNDARKVISTLRHNYNWQIQDYRQGDGCKVYWLEEDPRQLSLFPNEKGGIK